ncbi:DUF3267 domain-containing protein [Bacillus massiliglaciei]|uniref:DUF3267 domain-containing protein n=1 Tax=Bacillus massiliglaciei TaxID=1816693 RepID=UPI000DA60B8D|nr:DUF3267 domain-containing protein [Bacillus massiliglaciei]
MNSLKSINLARQYGQQRIQVLSILTMLISFLLIYTAMSAVLPGNLHDGLELIFIIGLFLLYPVHKLLHYIPLLLHYKNFKTSWSIKFMMMPVPKMQVLEPVSKRYYIFALCLPFMLINILLVILMALFTQYAHYFSILLSAHIGLCLSDFIYLKHIISMPQKCYIEKNGKEFDILINEE